MNRRTPQRGGCRGKDCAFVGAWVPIELISLLDRAVERHDSDRSKMLRRALEEKLAQVELDGTE